MQCHKSASSFALQTAKNGSRWRHKVYLLSLCFPCCLFHFLSSIVSPFDIRLPLPHSIFRSNKEIKEGLLLTCQCDVPAGLVLFFPPHAVLSRYNVHTHMHARTHTQVRIVWAGQKIEWKNRISDKLFHLGKCNTTMQKPPRRKW